MVQNNKSFLDSILGVLKKWWHKLEKIVRAIFDFLKDLINWFKAKYREIVKKHPKVEPIAIKIKEKIETRNYNTYNANIKEKMVRTFYDVEKEEVLIDNTEVVEYDSLDEQTKNAFGNKDMLILS